MEELDSDDTDVLFAENSNPEVFNLMESLFTDLFFTREEAAFADSFRSNVFDNQEQNESYNENVLDLLPRLEGVDLVIKKVSEWQKQLKKALWRNVFLKSGG